MTMAMVVVVMASVVMIMATIIHASWVPPAVCGHDERLAFMLSLAKAESFRDVESVTIITSVGEMFS